MEICTNYKERVEYIKEHKPRGEQEIRLRLFQLISPARLPRPLAKALEACDKTREAYDKALEACDKAWEAYDKTREAYDKALEACDKACEAYAKTLEAYKPQINELHKELCPDCPWDGKTIFAQSASK
jgi:tetratricopeptide (TPR) repeat protein